LFTLMLLAFVLVIAMSVAGMAAMYSLARGHTESAVVVLPAAGDGLLPLEQPGRTEDWRGLVSAGLALAAVLLGGATFFSSRVSRPITRLTRAAQTMASSLAAVDRQRRQLTADVAHELRTPLSIIRGRLEGMQDGVYSAGPEQLAALLAETALMERLIEDLRLLALADAGQLPLYPETFSPAQLLDSLARSFAHQAEKGNVNLQATTAPSLPELWADPQRISQVLGNLVTNALRYTPPGGTITLSAWYDLVAGQPQVCMAVSDTGTGIAPEDLPHVFDRFWRADRARSRRVAGGGDGSRAIERGGFGLGLAISQWIAHAHGGSLSVVSRLTRGSTFTVTLPIPTPEELAEAEAEG
jgi:two-component system OmpR family sensor kinase/two-component system sensor histidine kinase BaeS